MAKSFEGFHHNFQGVEREDHWYGGSLRFEWLKSEEELIRQLGFGRELHKALADIIAAYCTEFVPYKSGDLASYVQTFGAKDHGTITYQKPYASKQYYLEGRGYIQPNNYKRTTDFHPLASSLWDKQAWKLYKDDILADIEDERERICRTLE